VTPSARPNCGRRVTSRDYVSHIKLFKNHAAQRRGDGIPQHKVRSAWFDKVKFACVGRARRHGMGRVRHGRQKLANAEAIPTRWAAVRKPGFGGHRAAPRPPTSEPGTRYMGGAGPKPLTSTAMADNRGVMTRARRSRREEDTLTRMEMLPLTGGVLAKGRRVTTSPTCVMSTRRSSSISPTAFGIDVTSMWDPTR